MERRQVLLGEGLSLPEVMGPGLADETPCGGRLEGPIQKPMTRCWYPVCLSHGCGSGGYSHARDMRRLSIWSLDPDAKTRILCNTHTPIFRETRHQAKNLAKPQHFALKHLAVLSLSVLVASPAFAQDSLADQIIDRTFDDVFGSPSQSQYDQPGDDGGDEDVFLPAGAVQGLCGGIVQNNAIPFFVQVDIAQEFGLSCEPSGSSSTRSSTGSRFRDRGPLEA